MANTGIESIWIGTYGWYHEGDLVGDWLDLPYDPEKLDGFLKERCGVDALHEEYGVFDTNFEGPLGEIGLPYNEFWNLKDLNILSSVIENQTYLNTDAVKAWASYSDAHDALEFANIVQQADEIPYTPWASDPMNYSNDQEHLAYEYLDETGGVERLSEDELAKHFDFEGYGRDLAITDYDLGDNGFMDFVTSEVHEEYYDADEVHEEAEGYDAVSFDEAVEGLHEKLGMMRSVLREDDTQAVCDAWRIISNLDEEDIEPVRLYMDHLPPDVDALTAANVALQAESISYTPYEYDTMSHEASLGHQIAEDYGLEREDLELHFDYESYGRELAEDVIFTDEGYIWAVPNGPRLDWYDRDELLRLTGLDVYEEEVEEEGPQGIEEIVSDMREAAHVANEMVSESALEQAQAR